MDWRFIPFFFLGLAGCANSEFRYELEKATHGLIRADYSEPSKQPAESGTKEIVQAQSQVVSEQDIFGKNSLQNVDPRDPEERMRRQEKDPWGEYEREKIRIQAQVEQAKREKEIAEQTQKIEKKVNNTVYKSNNINENSTEAEVLEELSTALINRITKLDNQGYYFSHNSKTFAKWATGKTKLKNNNQIAIRYFKEIKKYIDNTDEAYNEIKAAKKISDKEKLYQDFFWGYNINTNVAIVYYDIQQFLNTVYKGTALANTVTPHEIYKQILYYPEDLKRKRNLADSDTLGDRILAIPMVMHKDKNFENKALYFVNNKIN